MGYFILSTCKDEKCTPINFKYKTRQLEPLKKWKVAIDLILLVVFYPYIYNIKKINPMSTQMIGVDMSMP